MGAVASLALSIAAVAALSVAAWAWDGLITGVMVACIGAAFLAVPILEAAIETRRAIRRAALAGLEGRHMEYRGRPLNVVEDIDHVRWIRVDDVRAHVGFTATDSALLLTYPSGARRFDDGVYLSDEALLLHLAREPGAPAHRMRRWAERRIVFPARQVRRRLGIRVAPPEAPAD